MEAAGVTKYKSTLKYRGSKEDEESEKELNKHLLRMTKVYQPALYDVLKRQEHISEFCVPLCPHPNAAALG